MQERRQLCAMRASSSRDRGPTKLYLGSLVNLFERHFGTDTPTLVRNTISGLWSRCCKDKKNTHTDKKKKIENFTNKR